MKKLLVSFVALLGIASCTQQPKSGFTLEGTLNGVPEGTTVTLVPMSHDDEDPIAEATIQADGKYLLKSDSLYANPACVYLRVEGGYGGELLMIEDGSATTLNATVTTDTTWNGSTLYKFGDVDLKGSPLNDKLKGYLAKREQLNALHDSLYAPFEDFEKKLAEVRQQKDGVAEKALWESEEGKALNAAEHEFFTTVEKTYNDAINENLDSYWGPLLALQYMTYFTPQQKELYESFSDEAKQSWYGQKMRSEIFPAGAPGEPAPVFSVKDNDGKEVTMAQLCEGQAYLLVDFWASWCGPCRREIPNVKNQYALYKDKGLQVVSISIDKDEAAWRKALDEEKLEWPNYLDDGTASKLYGVRSIPAMFLIDAKTGLTVTSGEDARGEALAAKLAELFAE